MKKGTLLLKIALLLIGVPVLAACILLFPGANLLKESDPGPAYLQYFVFYSYASAVPFYIALYQAFKLLRYIDQDNAFSEASLKSLKVIKVCAFVFCGMYIAVSPALFYLAQSDDAPGILALGLGFAFVSFIIAVFAAICQKLFKTAMDAKAKND